MIIAKILKIPIGDWIETFFEFLNRNISSFTKAFSESFNNGVDNTIDLFVGINPILLIIILSIIIFFLSSAKPNRITKANLREKYSNIKFLGHFIAWFLGKTKIMIKDRYAIKMTIGSFIGLIFCWNLGMWELTVSTIVLILIATLISILIGIPLGILAALYKKFYRIIIPILDVMQTMPAFVYLIPVIPLFRIGKLSAVLATVIFAIPPAIRLTCLGIKQLPEELIEAANAFGSTKKQKLIKVQLPLAVPTIMAGVNQTIMLSLSMVVIASMIGAGGLGKQVLWAVQNLKVGAGFEAGLGVVIIAIILDRVTQRIAGSGKNKK